MSVVDVTALPVELTMTGTLTARVRSHVEGSLGWQVVDDATFPAVVRLVGLESRGTGASSGLPSVLVVDDNTSAADLARAARRVDGIVAWPSQAAELEAVVTGVLRSRRAPRAAVPPLVVGGACGGVGTSTIALALAGLRAWQGQPTLAVTRGPLLVPAALALEVSALSAPGCWDAAPKVPGVLDLRAVRIDGPWVAPTEGGFAVGAVIDAGVDDDVDVLVARRDRIGVETARSTRAAVIVVLDVGVAPRRVMAAAADGRMVVPVRLSTRVASAHAARRVPSALPGRWLASLAPLVATS